MQKNSASKEREGDSPFLKLLWNIPFIGGFCAPTKNPDPSCYRHVSNEFTLPCGQGKFMDVAPWVEHSLFCIFFGKVGLPCAGDNRKRILSGAFSISLLALLLISYSLFALSQFSDVVKGAYWGKIAFLEPGLRLRAEMFVGTQLLVQQVDCSEMLVGGCDDILISHGFTKHNNLWEKEIEFDETCDDQKFFPLGASEHQEQFCSGCSSQVRRTGFLLIMGFLTQIRQLFGDLQRTTEFGDVNCQATIGVFTSFFGMISTLSALFSFNLACFEHLPGTIDIHSKEVLLDWERGPVFFCILFATLLKFIDFLVHLLTPTPSQRWQKPGPDIKSLEEYLLYGHAQETHALSRYPDFPGHVSEKSVSSPVTMPSSGSIGRPIDPDKE